jgi:hypothetical protein
MQGKIGKQTLVAIVMLCSVSIGLASMISWGPQPEQGADISMLASDGTHTTIEVQIQGIETGIVDADGVQCTTVNIPGSPQIMDVGFPEIPMVRQALIIPDRGDVVVTVMAVETRDIPCEKVVPSKGSLPRTVDPATVPYTFNEFYQQDRWFPEVVMANDDPFILRDVRGTVVQINAVRFNPAEKILRVVTRIVLDVRTQGDGGINTFNRRDPIIYVDREFQSIYSDLFINYDETDYVPIPEPGRMFIITDPLYTDAIDEFYQWKLQKGVPIELHTLDETGYTANQIKSFIQSAYDSPEGLTYIVLVGDIEDVPTLLGVVEGADSDPCYTKLAGNDNYPDALISRISAITPPAVEYQAYKFIRYEKLPDTGGAGAWYHKGTGIGGDDTGGTGLADWERVELLRQVLLGYNYTEIDQIYHASATVAQVTTAINGGRSLLNYIGHGATTYWGTTGFSNTNVYALSNGWKQPLIIDVACVNGDFSFGECFAEAWLRAGSMTDPKGAIGMYAASTNMDWVPPCDMQTHCVDLIATEGRTTMGGICFHGSMYCMDVNGAGNNDDGTQVFEQTNLFGDCNLMLRTDTPEVLTVNHDPAIFLGANTFTVQVPGESDLLACLYANGVQYGAAYTDETGSAQIVMDDPPTSPMTLTLTITGYNKATYIEDIDVLPPSGPYLVCDSLIVTDVENPNGMVEYGETVQLSVWLGNIGVGNAINTEATLSSGDHYVTITDNSETYGTILEGDHVGRTDAFEFQVHGDVPDGHYIQLMLTATADSGRLEFQCPLSIPAHSAAMQIAEFAIDDYNGNGNGILEAGETADITLTLQNDGSAGATSLTGVLTTDSPYLQIVTGSASNSGIASGASGVFAPDYRVSVQSSCPDFTPAVLYFAITGTRDYESHLLHSETLGGFQDMVENGQGSWTHAAGTAGWTDQWHISTEDSHSPTHSWKCGDSGTGNYATHMDAALVTPALDLPGGCTLSFWHWMAAEVSGLYPDSAYDGGVVEISVNGGAWTHIDPEEGYSHIIRYTAGGGSPYTGPFNGGTLCYSGQIPWSQETFDLSGYSGSVQIRFRFGSDNAVSLEGWYVDDIRVNTESVGVAPSNLQAALAGSEVTLTWSSPGVDPLMSLLSYNIYRNSAKIDSMVQAISYMDDLAQMPYGTYLYQVSAQYDVGEGALSDPVPVDYGTIGIVHNLVIAVLGNDIRLDWSLVAGATGYRVYYGDNPQDLMGDDTRSLLATTTDNYYVHQGGIRFADCKFYVVTAIDE